MFENTSKIRPIRSLEQSRISMSGVDHFLLKKLPSTRMVATSKPEIVFWQKLIITAQGKWARRVSLSNGIVCDWRKKSKTEKVTFLLQHTRFYESSYTFCNQINAEMFYPRTEQQLDLLVSRIGDLISDKCNQIFWVPIVRSKSNSSQWVYDGKKYMSEEIMTFSPWRKTEPDNAAVERDCLFFNILSKEFHEVSCDEERPLCTVFALDEKRLKFNLRSICDDLSQLDEIYFLKQDKNLRGLLTFQGIAGLSSIQLTEPEYKDKSWTMSPLRYKMDHTSIFNATSEVIYPIGLKTWESKLSCADYPASYSKQLFNFNNVIFKLIKNQRIENSLKFF